MVTGFNSLPCSSQVFRLRDVCLFSTFFHKGSKFGERRIGPISLQCSTLLYISSPFTLELDRQLYRILTFSLAKSSTSRLGVVSLAAFIFSRKSERSLRASASLIPTFGQFYNLFRNAKLTTLQLPYLSFSNFLAD